MNKQLLQIAKVLTAEPRQGESLFRDLCECVSVGASRRVAIASQIGAYRAAVWHFHSIRGLPHLGREELSLKDGFS